MPGGKDAEEVEEEDYREIDAKEKEAAFGRILKNFPLEKRRQDKEKQRP
jgi:hypothetical protein